MIFYPQLLSASQQLKANAAGLIRRLQTTVEHIRVTNAEAADDMLRGHIVCLTAGVRQALLAQADDLGTSEQVGVCCEDIDVDATGIVRTNGKAWVLFETLDPAPLAGEPAYLSASDQGLATNVAPVGVGDYIVQIGLIEDASSYATLGGCYVQLQRCCFETPVL